MYSKTLNFLFIIAFLVIGTVIFVTFNAYTKLERYNRLVDHSYNVKNKIAETENEFRSMVISQRTFILTKDVEYYDLYLVKKVGVKKFLKELHSLMHDNVDQTALLDLIIKKYFEREKSLNQEIDAFKSNGHLSQVLKNELLNNGGKISQELKELFTKIKNEEDILIADRMKNQMDGQRIAPITFSILGLLSIAIIAFAYFRQKSDLEEKEEILHKKRVLLKKLMSSQEEIEEYTLVTSHHLQEPVRKIQIFADRALQAIKDSKSEDAEKYISKIDALANDTTELLKELSTHSRFNFDEDGLGLYSFVDLFMRLIADFNDQEDQKILLMVQDEIVPKLLLYPKLMNKMFEQLIAYSYAQSNNQENVRFELFYNSTIQNGLNWHEIILKLKGENSNSGGFAKLFDVLSALKVRENEKVVQMSVVKKVMRIHHGNVFAESEHGCSAVFRFYFPF